MSESLIFTKIERALLSIKEALPWFSKDSLNYQCLVRDIKKYGEDCREEGLKDGKRNHHISIADIDTVSKLYGEIKELKQTLDVERQENAHLRHHISEQSAEIENLQKQTGKRKDLKHKIARLEIDVRDRDNIILHLEDANKSLKETLEKRTEENTSYELGWAEAHSQIETLKANLLNTKLMLEDCRRRNRESEPMAVSIHGVGRISGAGMRLWGLTNSEALAHGIGSCGYDVKHCDKAMQLIKAHLDAAHYRGKDEAEKEFKSQIEYLQARLKHQEDRACAKKRELENRIDELNAKYESVTENMQATINEQKYMLELDQRSDEHMHGIISKLEREKKELEGDVRQRDSVISQLKDLHNKLKCQLQESFVMLNNKSAQIKELEELERSNKWHDAKKLLPIGGKRLEVQISGYDNYGGKMLFQRHATAIHKGDSLTWNLEISIDQEGEIVRWRYADE